MISRNLFTESKKLRVFDFDDTLVKTTSFIYITNNGKKKKCFGIHTNDNYIIKMKIYHFSMVYEYILSLIIFIYQQKKSPSSFKIT